MNVSVSQNWKLFSIFALAAFVLSTSIFAFKQSLWVDEATQLSGLTLSMSEIYLWLSGVDAGRFLVPHDRMPALSYLFGKLWQSLFGSDPVIMRFLSISLVLVSFGYLVKTVSKNKYNSILVCALLFLALSPNMTIFAVEIRAYGLFFALSLISCLLYIEILDSLKDQKQILTQVVWLSIALSLAINTHFFGIVLAGGIFSSFVVSSLFYHYVKIDKKVVFVFLSVIAVGLLIVFPQIKFSAGATGSVAAENEGFFASIVYPSVKLIYRLVAHQTMAGNLFIDAISIVLVYGVILVALFKKLTPLKVAMIATLVAGVLAALAAKLVSTKFDALSPQYNIWMFPFLAVLFGASIVDFNKKTQTIIITLLAFFFLYGQFNLITAGEKYAHTRFNTLEKLIEEHSSENTNVSVVYHAPLGKTWFAGLYKLGDEISQYVPNERGYRNLKSGEIVDKDILENKSDLIFAISGKNIFSNELATSPSDTELTPNSDVFTLITPNSDKWIIKFSRMYYAQESGEIVIYEKSN